MSNFQQEKSLAAAATATRLTTGMAGTLNSREHMLNNRKHSHHFDIEIINFLEVIFIIIMNNDYFIYIYIYKKKN